MAAPFLIPVTPAAMLAAVACVVAGGPWFADGLRALRQRRALATLSSGTDTPLREGPVTARGYVVLASPLFAPLSGRPCAGYVLEVGSPVTRMVGRVSDLRAFRLATREGIADVEAGAGLWEMAIGTERTVGSAAELSENLGVLLASTPELRWLSAFGGSLVLRERALLAGSAAVVLGVATPRLAEAASEAIVLGRTGTDDGAWLENAPAARAGSHTAPAWSIGAAEPFERCIITDGTPGAARFAPPAWRLSGLVLGPLLSLAGLLMLANAAGHVLDMSL